MGAFMNYLKTTLTMFGVLTAFGSTQARSYPIYQTYEQQIDHFGEANGTFPQRYWIDSQYASGPDAPVVLRLGGEGNIEYFVNTDASSYFARKLGAHVIYLEHRYYGASQPFQDLSAEHLQFLTVENAIEDTAQFQREIATQRHFTGKWIVVGGSYSGTLAAFYRLRHPELVVGALSSSAPIYRTTLPVSDDDRYIRNTEIPYSSAENPAGYRQWAYQACTVFRFWVAKSQIGGIVYEPSHDLCKTHFNINQFMDDATYNQRYIEPFTTPSNHSASNILFTNGSLDTWSRFGLKADKNHNPAILTRMISGAAHHEDLNLPSDNDAQPIQESRKYFLKLAARWLN
jgi:pimeloyl-ACP methyl ester carboxylesterase